MTEQPEKKKMGRPRKTLADLPENWKQIIFDLAQDGDGPTAWKVYLGIGHDTYNSLLENEPDFQSAVKEADILHQLYYERQGKRMVNGGAGNSNVYALLMYNKFGYKSAKADHTVVATIEQNTTVKNAELTGEELERQLKARGLPTTLLIEHQDTNED